MNNVNPKPSRCAFTGAGLLELLDALAFEFLLPELVFLLPPLDGFLSVEGRGLRWLGRDVVFEEVAGLSLGREVKNAPRTSS